MNDHERSVVTEPGEIAGLEVVTPSRVATPARDQVLTLIVWQPLVDKHARRGGQLDAGHGDGGITRAQSGGSRGSRETAIGTDGIRTNRWGNSARGRTGRRSRCTGASLIQNKCDCRCRVKNNLQRKSACIRGWAGSRVGIDQRQVPVTEIDGKRTEVVSDAVRCLSQHV